MEDKNDEDKDGVDYFAKLISGKSGQEELQATLWQDFCNTITILCFKAILDSSKTEDGGSEARDHAAEVVISEPKKRAMLLMSAQVNQYAEMKRTTLGKLIGGIGPDEETVKIRFSEAVKEVETTARKMFK